MSIAGVLPPICDYIDGHLLLDGCYTNNVPGKEKIYIFMKKKHKQRIGYHYHTLEIFFQNQTLFFLLVLIL